mgnify:CR=1 FL=1
MGYLIPLAIVLLVVYLYLLLHSNGSKEYKRLLYGCVVILIFGIIIHFRLYKGEADILSTLIRSVVSSVELFIGDSHIEDIIISKKMEYEPLKDWELLAYFVVYAFALITSAYFIIKLLFLRFLKNLKIRIKYNLFKTNAHFNIFFEKNEPTNILVEELLKKEKEKVFIICSPKDSTTRKLRFFEFFTMDYFNDDSQPDGLTTITSKKALNRIRSESSDKIFEEIKCGSLKKRIIKNADFYFLSDDETNNIKLALKFASLDLGGKVYCHCRQELITKYYAEAYCYYNITFVDSAKLAVASLKKNQEFQPINYVDIATDSMGRKCGYVESSFNALILGFGQTGQEALSFLYEYGAFVDKNKKRSGFHCVVYDNNMDKIKGSFVNARPYMDKNLITFRNIDVCSEDFWLRLNSESTGLFAKPFIQQVNYIVVSLGNDHTNLQVAIELLEHLYKSKNKDLSKLAIMVHLKNDDLLNMNALSYYQKMYSAQDRNVICPFGCNGSIWKLDLISDESMIKDSAKFFEAYQKATDEMFCDREMSPAYNETIKKLSESLSEKISKNRCEEYCDFIKGIIKQANDDDLRNKIVEDAQSFIDNPLGLACFLAIVQKKYIKGFRSRRIRKNLLKAILVLAQKDTYLSIIGKMNIGKDDNEMRKYMDFPNGILDEIYKIDRQEMQDFSNSFPL